MRVVHYNKKLLQALNLLLVLAIVSIVSIGCPDPLYNICIENQTDHSLTIFIGGYPRGDIVDIGDVKSGSEITFNDIWFEEYSIEAQNSRGKRIFYRKYTWDELDEMNWKVVIPPLEKGVENSDNVTEE